MTASARSATQSDEILGVRPRIVREPATVEEAAVVLAESASSGDRIAFIGGGTDLELGAPPEGLETVLSTARLSRIVEHAPADQIVVAQAGVPLDRLQSALAAHGQRLALDPPLPQRATVGGIVAANAYGPRRARFGSVRDLIIGVSIVRCDGTVAKGGGKVVKNVAGFDLPKLMAGSLGTLGLIATATFRLHPLPEEERTLLVAGIGAVRVRELVVDARAAQLEPVSTAALWREGNLFDLAVRFEGFGKGVGEQCEKFSGLSGARTASCEILDENSAASFWKKHDMVRTSGSLRGKITALPARLEAIGRDVLPPLLSCLADPGFVWYASLGIGFFQGSPADACAGAQAIESARGKLAGLGGFLTLSAAPEAIRRRVDVWGPPPPAIALMRRMKANFDPDRRLAPGRFVGGI